MSSKQCNNDGNQGLKVPGHGLPIDFQIEEAQEVSGVGGYFRHGINDFRPARYTAKELAILQLMDAVTEKPDWDKKVFDDTIVNKWKTESQAQNGSLITDNTFDWCLKELRDKAEAFQAQKYVHTLEGPSTIIKSDSYISKMLQSELKKELLLLLDDPDKDFHPNSNNQVVNQVHPSLYPLIYKKTRVLSTGLVDLENILDFYGKGEVTNGDQSLAQTNGIWSSNFQWLPCEVKFQGDGNDVKITSYINNLHPLYYPSLYPVIEKFISLSIPLWNEVIIKSAAKEDREGHANLRVAGILEAEYDPPEPNWAGQYLKSDDYELIQKAKDFLALPDNPEMDLSDDSIDPTSVDIANTGLYYVINWKWMRARKLIHPEPMPDLYQSWKEDKKPAVRLQDEFRKDGLQVIVKLSSIELTPENPDYPGGNWHLEVSAFTITKIPIIRLLVLFKSMDLHVLRFES
jgi:hypothetical protein